MDLRSLLNNAQSSISNTYDNRVDQLIDRLGLERQQSQSDSILPAIGIFSAGLAVGAILGLVFAPKRGEELRGDINDQIDVLRDQLDTLSVKSRMQYESLLSRGGDLIESAKAKLPSSGDLESVKEKVEEKAHQVAEKVKEEAKDAASKVEEGAEKVASKVSDVAEKGKEAAEEAKEKAERALK